MIAQLVLETGLSERQLVDDCTPETLDAIVELLNAGGSGQLGRTAQGERMLQRLRGGA